ncbi:unannotated protein [freshwater metagenome]|uniref:Unannotated protein n=1 Tax=freshwater metagenome TaxID=449393 RepID=A0A6J7F255_9ZZZZ
MRPTVSGCTPDVGLTKKVCARSTDASPVRAPLIASTRMPVVRTETPTTAAPSGFIIIARICRPARLERIQTMTAASMRIATTIAPSWPFPMPLPATSTRPVPKIGGSGLFCGPKKMSQTCVPIRLIARVAMRLRVLKLSRSCRGRKATAPTARPVTAEPSMPDAISPTDRATPSMP